MSESIEKIAEMIVRSRRIVVFVGSGLSTESGFPAGAEGMTSRPEEFRPFLEREIAKLARIVKESAAKVD